jgi:hypothetical protein
VTTGKAISFQPLIILPDNAGFNGTSTTNGNSGGAPLTDIGFQNTRTSALILTQRIALRSLSTLVP